MYGRKQQRPTPSKKKKRKSKVGNNNSSSSSTVKSASSSRPRVKGAKVSTTPPKGDGGVIKSDSNKKKKKKIHLVDVQNVINKEKRDDGETTIIEPEIVTNHKKRRRSKQDEKHKKMATKYFDAVDATVVTNESDDDDDDDDVMEMSSNNNKVVDTTTSGVDSKKKKIKREFDPITKDGKPVVEATTKIDNSSETKKAFDISNEAIRKNREEKKKLIADASKDNVVAKQQQQQRQQQEQLTDSKEQEEEEQHPPPPPKIETNREVNVNVVGDRELKVGMSDAHMNITTFLKNATVNITGEQRKRLEREDEMVQSGQDAMDEMIDVHGEEMTAEDLLKSVLKFDEKIKKEEAPGSGFVSGAMEKAKELLREQQARYNEKKQQQEVREASRLSSPIPDIGTYDREEAAKLAAMDESKLTMEQKLRKMFQAGEHAAENRIQDKEKMAGSGELTPEQNKIVDDLIAQEKEVSDYARVIDDELVELEMRINRSPDEELDGPKKHPFHDVMSGPEVYDPNVDPETAVNWPGAPQRDKAGKIRLPKELDEAVKHAQFAASVLLRLARVEVKPEGGGAVDNEEDGKNATKEYKFFLGKKEVTQKNVEDCRDVAFEAVSIGIIDDPFKYMEERARLGVLVNELFHQPEERFKPIAENYKDLFLSDNFVPLVKERMKEMASRDMEARNVNGSVPEIESDHLRERDLLGQMVNYTQVLLKETQAYGAQMEASQIEIIRSICEVAMDPKYETEEETAMALTDAVRDMRPLFDDAFLAYLKYAILEEEGRLARAGTLDDPRHNQWWMILKIIQQGVHKEVSRSINRLVDHLFYVLRMHTREERRQFLSMLIDDMPTMDVRPFVELVDSVLMSLGDVVRGEFTGNSYELGRMTNKLLQLKRDVEELLPPERVDRMAKDADEWAERQRKKIMEARQFSQQRMAAGLELEGDLRNPEVQERLRRPSGDMEKFDRF